MCCLCLPRILLFIVVVQLLSHVWLCDPMDCSMPGSSVLHQSIRASASACVFPMNIQGWFPLELTGLISCCPRDSQKSSPVALLLIASSPSHGLWGDSVIVPHLLLVSGISIWPGCCILVLCPWYSVHNVISHPDRHSKHASKRLDRWKLGRKDVCLWGYSEDCVLRDWSGPLSAIWRELPEKERMCEEMSAEIGMEAESVKAWQKWGCRLHIWIPTRLKPAIFLGFWLMNAFLFQFDFYHLRPKDSWPFVPNFICFLPVAFLAYKIPFLFWLALLMEFFTVYIKSVVFYNSEVPEQCLLDCLSQVWCLAWGRDVQ